MQVGIEWPSEFGVNQGIFVTYPEHATRICHSGQATMMYVFFQVENSKLKSSDQPERRSNQP